MGHSTEPDDTTEDCLACFPAGESPDEIYVGIVGGNESNGTWGLPREPGYPCDYRATYNFIEYWYASALFFGSWMKAKFGPVFLFNSWLPDNCQYVFEDGDADAIVMWNAGPTDHSIGSLLNAINMRPDSETKFDFTPASENRACVRFARKSDATNILILVEPTEL